MNTINNKMLQRTKEFVYKKKQIKKTYRLRDLQNNIKINLFKNKYKLKRNRKYVLVTHS